MRNSSLSKAFAAFFRTGAFLPLRLAVALASLACLALLVWAGLSHGSGRIGAVGGMDLGQVLGALAGLALWLALMRVLRGPVLAWVRLPHAVALDFGLTDPPEPDPEPDPEAADQGPVASLDPTPIPGPGAALARVRQGVGGPMAVHRLDYLVRAVVRGTMTLVDEGAAAQDPGLRDRALRLYRRLSVAAVTEMILGHALGSGPGNGWDRAHDGTVLLAQNTERLLGMAGRLVLSGWLLSVLLLLALLDPVQALAAGLLGPEVGSLSALALAMIPAALVKEVLVDPLILAALLQRFRTVTADQAPNAEWRGLMSHAMPAFLHLGERAEAWVPPRSRLPAEAE